MSAEMVVAPAESHADGLMGSDGHMGMGAPFPSPEADLYPVYCGPPTFYPAEARASVEHGVFCRPPSYDHGVFARSRVAPVELEPCAPPPIVDSRTTFEHWPEDWYPTAVRSFARKVRAAGLEARVGFSRGWVPGRAAGTFAIRDLIGCWVSGRGGRLVMIWERNPESGTASGQSWKCKGGHVVNGRTGMSQSEVLAWMEGAR